MIPVSGLPIRFGFLQLTIIDSILLLFFEDDPILMWHELIPWDFCTACPNK